MAEPARPPVALAPVADDAAVPGVLHRLLELLDEPLAGLRPGAEVLIKPNLFQTTPGFHVSPALLAAIARAVAEHGARPVIAERTHAIYEILNDHEAARYARVVSFDDLPLRITNIPGATSLRVPIAVPELIEDCDYFIGVPQLRTHASVVYSNAMKNLVGLLPGYTTRIVHMAGVDESTVDLNLMRPQDLVICDGTTVIEGNYPMDGRARSVGFLAASRTRSPSTSRSACWPASTRTASPICATHTSAVWAHSRSRTSTCAARRWRTSPSTWSRRRSRSFRRVRASTSTPSTPARRAAGSWPGPCAHSPRSCAPGTAR